MRPRRPRSRGRSGCARGFSSFSAPWWLGLFQVEGTPACDEDEAREARLGLPGFRGGKAPAGADPLVDSAPIRVVREPKNALRADDARGQTSEPFAQARAVEGLVDCDAGAL